MFDITSYVETPGVELVSVVEIDADSGAAVIDEERAVLTVADSSALVPALLTTLLLSD